MPPPTLIGEGDLLVRLGGDEFAMLMRDTGGPGDADLQARRMVEALATPFEDDGHIVEIGGSIGVTCHPAPTGSGPLLDLDTLLREADAALYEGKRLGGSVHRLVQPPIGWRSAA